MSPSRTNSQRVSLGDVTPNNIGQLRKLHATLFPITYSDNFYNEVLEVGELAKLVYYNDVCVGAVCCRKEATEGDKFRIYMMTLGVLEPYRRNGLGAMLLEHILKEAANMPQVEAVTLHVQVTNEDALNFYKKFGFESVGVKKDYYTQITPKDAYILSKAV